MPHKTHWGDPSSEKNAGANASKQEARLATSVHSVPGNKRQRQAVPASCVVSGTMEVEVKDALTFPVE